VITNINARRTTDGGVFVQYQEDGKAKDGVHSSWGMFIVWLTEHFKVQNEKTSHSS